MVNRRSTAARLIWGARDTLVSEAGREALRSGLAQVDVRTFASLGHDLFWEDPRAVAAVMIDFLAKP
jgi:pimeloyl-ACP methyl ester carboxylesterase